MFKRLPLDYFQECARKKTIKQKLELLITLIRSVGFFYGIKVWCVYCSYFTRRVIRHDEAAAIVAVMLELELNLSDVYSTMKRTESEISVEVEIPEGKTKTDTYSHLGCKMPRIIRPRSRRYDWR